MACRQRQSRYAEWRSRLEQRDADTDDDGIDDGDEHTGKVESFEDGVLTISLFDGGELSAAVTDDTEIECDSEPGDDRGEDEQGDDDDQGEDEHGDDDRSLKDDDDEGNEDCGTEALQPGAKVLEAELKVSGGEAVWTEVELLAP
jgi:hypothetical protein